MNLLVLGINAYHGDSAACLVRNGEIVSAAEEERFRRIKHWAGFPSEAIRFCLDEAGIGLEAVDRIAINSDPQANLVRKVSHTLMNCPEIGLLMDRMRNWRKRISIEQELDRSFPGARFRGEIDRVEHHRAHLASAFLVSPFAEAVTASIDGLGDFCSAAWGVGRGADIVIDDRIYFPHSLGIFYQALTQYLGFSHYGDEYKVMGLAPYGEPRFLPELRKIVLLEADGRFRLDTRYFRHHREKIAHQWSDGSPAFGTLYSPALLDLLGPAREADAHLEQWHRDIARSVQAMYEEAFFHLLDHLYGRYRLDTLTLAGGCAMNSVANGKVARRSAFKRLYVQSAAGDAGGAIGAALVAWRDAGGTMSKGHVSATPLASDKTLAHSVMDHAYLGPAASAETIYALLEANQDRLVEAGCAVEVVLDESQLCSRTAAAVADGLVVGWFQGRMEWGPRALGNRSILGDPRRADMKDILNLKIKRRESFRPFAPSVLKEHVAEWFEEDGDVPFMMQVYQIQEGKRSSIPAVTHVDGSGRLQTVYHETNPRYWQLIDQFRRITGVPMVLNTSFNENEPVVCQPEEALECFLRTKMDVLVLGDRFVSRILT
jgi:carbamoyltransferase